MYLMFAFMFRLRGKKLSRRRRLPRLSRGSEHTKKKAEKHNFYWSNNQKARNKREVHSSLAEPETRKY